VIGTGALYPRGISGVVHGTDETGSGIALVSTSAATSTRCSSGRDRRSRHGATLVGTGINPGFVLDLVSG
jgi:hypothetical protein